MAGDTDKTGLIRELDAARARIARAGDELRHKLDVPGRVGESFERHRPAWLGGAALLGLLLSKLPSRKKTVFVESGTGETLGVAGRLGFLWGAVKFVGGIAKPLLGELAGQRLGEFARRFTKPQGNGTEEK